MVLPSALIAPFPFIEVVDNIFDDTPRNIWRMKNWVSVSAVLCALDLTYDVDLTYDDYDDESHEIALVFRRPTYRVRIAVGVKSNTSLTVASLLNKGGGPNLIQKSFLSRGMVQADQDRSCSPHT